MGMSNFDLLPFHDFHAVDPGGWFSILSRFPDGRLPPRSNFALAAMNFSLCFTQPTAVILAFARGISETALKRM
jgi:hypothetical protein